MSVCCKGRVVHGSIIPFTVPARSARRASGTMTLGYVAFASPFDTAHLVLHVLPMLLCVQRARNWIAAARFFGSILQQLPLAF
jgi:hypothetical protein